MPQGQALGGRRQALARVLLGCLAVLGLLCGRGGGVSLAEGDPPAASASATSRRLLGSAITHAVVPMADGLVYGSVSPDAPPDSAVRFGYALAGGSGNAMTPVRITATKGRLVTSVGATRLASIVSSAASPSSIAVTTLRGAAGKYSIDTYLGVVAVEETLFFIVSKDGGFTRFEVRVHSLY